MPYYKQEFDPVKSLEGKTKIPKALLDLPQIIAEQQARKVGPRPLQVDSEDEKILEFFREFFEINRIHEQLITIEELNALFGQVIVCLDKYEDNPIPRISYADPFMLSLVGKIEEAQGVGNPTITIEK